jgi:hypothetical protein
VPEKALSVSDDLKRQGDADTLKQVPEKTLSVSALCSRTFSYKYLKIGADTLK